jgi:RNA polymerase sigma-70 factor (ECF subfamily)
MAAAQRGDSAAYRALLLSLLAPLRTFVQRRGVEASEVEDVVQEILLLLHRARHTWRAERPFGPWFWAIARNAASDALRRQARARSRRAALPEGFEEDSAAIAAFLAEHGVRDPEQELASREISPRIAAALGALPPAQRQAVELLYLEQLSVAEAAARAGVSATALKVRAHRGARALRAAVGAEKSR